MLHLFHSSLEGGHLEASTIMKRLGSVVHWKGLKRDMRAFIRICNVCQQFKSDHATSPRLLQPLPILEKVWSDISMDFIEGLPNSKGVTLIMVVVDRLSKYAHFLTLSHPYSALTVAQLFLDNIYKLHGLPNSIVTDRDKIFVSRFWQEVFKLLGTQLKLSTAYHPQTDGQSEVTNRTLQTYLRCMASEKPKEWSKWIPLAEWWYNTSYHYAIHATPYEIVYGQPAPTHLSYSVKESKVEAVDRSLKAREAAIKLLKFYLNRARNRMKQQADRKRSDRNFEVGDLVYVKLQPYRQSTVVNRKYLKLSAKFFGPYKVEEKIGPVAYRLELPPCSRVHPVFHVSQLKLHVGPVESHIALPIIDVDGSIAKEPISILDRKMVKKQGTASTEVLVQWKNKILEDATWESLPSFQQ